MALVQNFPLNIRRFSERRKISGKMRQRKKNPDTFYFLLCFFKNKREKSMGFHCNQNLLTQQTVWVLNCNLPMKYQLYMTVVEYQISISITSPDLCHIRGKQTYFLTCAKYHSVQKCIFSGGRKWSCKLFWWLTDGTQKLINGSSRWIL